jgi:hypothetical protein
MLVLMLDLHFKNLQFIWHYVGFELVTQVVIEYVQEIMMPLLLLVYKALMLIIMTWPYCT